MIGRRRARGLVAFTLGLVAALATAAARAEEGPADSIEIGLGLRAGRVPLSRAAFRGEGTLLGGQSKVAFRATGKELGYDAPVFVGLELPLRYRGRYWRAGAQLAMLAPTTAREGASVLTEPIRVLFEVAGELAVQVPIDRFALRAGTLSGVRLASVQLEGYELTSCGGRTHDQPFSGASPCKESAQSASPFLQPRLSADYAVWRGRNVLWLGTFVGADVIPALAVHGGVTFTVSVGW